MRGDSAPSYVLGYKSRRGARGSSPLLSPLRSSLTWLSDAVRLCSSSQFLLSTSKFTRRGNVTQTRAIKRGRARATAVKRTRCCDDASDRNAHGTRSKSQLARWSPSAALCSALRSASEADLRASVGGACGCISVHSRRSQCGGLDSGCSEALLPHLACDHSRSRGVAQRGVHAFTQLACVWLCAPLLPDRRFLLAATHFPPLFAISAQLPVLAASTHNRPRKRRHRIGAN